jgi:exodeoxyribonuclease VII large subunit
VQGTEAPAEIVQGLSDIGSWPGIDVVIVGRGGGSKEDLSAWNDEGVARAIAACPVPVVSAVGHEIDVTVADLVADLRAATPSEAAELVVPDQLELGEQVADCAGRLHRAMREQIEGARATLQAIAESYALRHPAERVRTMQQRCDDLSERLTAGVRGALRTADLRAQAMIGRLESLSPLKVLGRGYSVTQVGGRALLDPADAPAGTDLRILLHEGALRAKSGGAE